MRNGLLNFVSPNPSSSAAALVIESEKYLRGLRELMPAARIKFLTTEKSKKIFDLCDELKIDLLIGDYTRDGLSGEPKIFDVILAEDCFTFAPDCWRTLLEINHLLKDSGYVVMKFFNVRFIGLLELLREGKFPTNEKNFRAKWDVVKILNDAIYKEVSFAPGERFTEKDFPQIKNWIAFGFDNFSEDLLTRTWLVQARKCESEVAALKEVYTEEIRARLARLIHRVEYKIDPEENFRTLMKFCKDEKIFDEYLSDFIRQIVVHKDAFEFMKRSAKNFNVNIE